MADDMTNPSGDAAYALVELFGHRQIAGQVREVERYGTRMLRIDVPAVAGRPAATHYYGGSAIYGEHPTDQATAERLAAQLFTPPAHQMALGVGQATTHDDPDLDPEPDDDSDAWAGDGPF